MKFQSVMAKEGVLVYLVILKWGTESFICRPRVDFWVVGVRVLQVWETSAWPPVTLYIMAALGTLCRVFSVSNAKLKGTSCGTVALQDTACWMSLHFFRGVWQVLLMRTPHGGSIPHDAAYPTMGRTLPLKQSVWIVIGQPWRWRSCLPSCLEKNVVLRYWEGR